MGSASQQGPEDRRPRLVLRPFVAYRSSSGHLWAPVGCGPDGPRAGRHRPPPGRKRVLAARENRPGQTAPRSVQRLGGCVQRPVAFWSQAVHGLLTHLEAVDFPAPRLRAVTGDYEELTWIEGESGPDAWAKVVTEDGLRKWGAYVIYSLEYGVPFRDDATCSAHMRFPAPPDRQQRTELFLDAYDMSAPTGLAALVADRQLQDLKLVADLAGRGIEPQATWVRDGYLDKIRQRVGWTVSSGL